MLYFSKFKIISVIIFTLLLSYFTASNFFKFDDNFINRNINLGLDLQGGSYLLLEIDNKPVIIQHLQNKLVQIKKYFKEKKISLKNIILQDNEKIYFIVDQAHIEETRSLLDSDDSKINPYFQQFKSHQFNIENSDNEFILSFSKYGLIQIKSSSQNQAIEIVRRRVDEIGTNEPNILKQGNNRILVELPGLNDPGRIKSLLGKTANLTFRFVTQNEEESFGTEKLFF
ncbi:MAG: protein translocase subunit SecD, partial [Candidatus Pelagibacter bacterium]|nr:protein translocase subunit SecD [Candidatus Pelagibacter bacterium]